MKWFNADKGYGFVTANGQDYFVHFSFIEMPGYRSLTEGDLVEFDAILRDAEKGRWDAQHIRVWDGSEPEEQTPSVDAVAQDEYLAAALFDNGIRLISVAGDGTYRFLDGTNQYHHILYVESIETKLYSEAAQELEHLINSKNSSESELQDFFERNPNFITGTEYAVAHPHSAE